ncbi:MAG: Oligopeptide-binding protein AppA [Firmicutes bacterium]|nr:Oligopeptide-binding protein AppA [candidate division NPL-UPA2 bacterium]
MVPVRFVAENLGATVEWIEAERIVRITRDMPALPPIGGILNRGTNMEPDTLNPLFSNNNMSRWINTITNLGLIRLDEQGIPVNSLADRWTWDAQTLTFRFWLRQGVRWHDGRTFSAADVKFTFDTRAYFKEIPAPQYEFVRPNMGNRILADRRVRIALMHAIDRPAMVNSMLDGRAHVMLGHQLPTSWAFLRTGLEPYAFNRTRAIQLLTEAGFRTIGADGIRRNAAGDRMSFTLLTTAGNSLRADMAAYLQDMWKRIGISAHSTAAPLTLCCWPPGWKQTLTPSSTSTPVKD